MQIGVGIPVRYRPDEAKPLEDTFRLAELAEKAGFDFLSLGHHVFTPDYPSPSPFTMLAGIAARTERIRLASVIFLLPLHNPVAVAEQVATVDIMSGGRMILGVGVGYRDYEFEGYGVDPKRRGKRTSEALAAIRQAWTTGRWNFSGSEFTIPDLPAVPLPKQKPHPPIWVGGTSGPALARGAKLGDGWVATNMQPLDDIIAMSDSYRAQASAAGNASFTCISRDAWLADSRGQMLEEWYGDTRDRHLAFRRMGFAASDPEGVMDRLDKGEAVDPMDFIRDRVIGGTADDVIGQLRGWEQKARPDAMLMLLNKKASYDQLARVIERMGRDVLPALKA